LLREGDSTTPEEVAGLRLLKCSAAVSTIVPDNLEAWSCRGSQSVPSRSTTVVSRQISGNFPAAEFLRALCDAEIPVQPVSPGRKSFCHCPDSCICAHPLDTVRLALVGPGLRFVRDRRFGPCFPAVPGLQAGPSRPFVQTYPDLPVVPIVPPVPAVLLVQPPARLPGSFGNQEPTAQAKLCCKIAFSSCCFSFGRSMHTTTPRGG
jgi:hypothetical protein